VQLAWGILAALWNFAGVWRIAEGLRAPGPTASVATGLVLLALTAACLATIARSPVVCGLPSAAAGLLAFAAVVGAFVQDPAL
jgi:hypothetical protein